jgi:Tfp pilus assembly major pilin PilA
MILFVLLLMLLLQLLVVEVVVVVVVVVVVAVVGVVVVAAVAVVVVVAVAAGVLAAGAGAAAGAAAAGAAADTSAAPRSSATSVGPNTPRVAVAIRCVRFVLTKTGTRFISASSLNQRMGLAFPDSSYKNQQPGHETSMPSQWKNKRNTQPSAFRGTSRARPRGFFAHFAEMSRVVLGFGLNVCNDSDIFI